MKSKVELPFMVRHIDEYNRDMAFGIDVPLRIDADDVDSWDSSKSEFAKTGKTNLKIKEIWVEWMETHWRQSTIDDPERCLKKGEVYAEETSRFGRCYHNETFAKAFVMSLAMGQKTTLDMKSDEFECWEGFDPQTDPDNFPTVAVRMGSYPDMSDARFKYLVERYLDHGLSNIHNVLHLSERNKMTPNRLIVMNYYFEKGEEQ